VTAVGRVPFDECASQAQVWIAIFSYVGNYFWTHYFYKVLGAVYTIQVSLWRAIVCKVLRTE